MRDNSLERLSSKLPPDYSISEDVLEKVRDILEAETKKTLKFLQAISHPTRLRILRALEINELCVCVFVNLMKIKYSKLSYHLKILKDAGLVEFRKEKNFLIYRLTNLGRKVLKDIES
ncbi:MAG: metalloregulator ArsR/SmtB family transcription factor [Candidatus Hadarchaeum sp.]